MGFGIKSKILKKAKLVRSALRTAPAVYGRYQNYPGIIWANASGTTPPEVVLREGVRFASGPASAVVSIIDEIFFDRCYTPAFLPIGEDDSVVDIGGNVGIFAVYAARRTKNKVHTFEPFPENFSYLSRNVEWNGLSNVTARMMAVSDRAGEMKLFVNSHSGGHSLVGPGKGDTGQTLAVRTIKLEDLFEVCGLDRIDFLKMDTEGSEFPAFLSADKSCFARIRKIALEYHDNISGHKHPELVELLKSAGFEVRAEPMFPPHSGVLYAWKKA